MSQQMQLFIDRIRIQYNVKREYLTLGLPIILAILFLVASVGLGLAQIGEEASGDEGKSEEQLAYEELVRQMEAEEAGIDPATLEEPEAAEQPESEPEGEKLGIDHFLIYAFLIAITPYAVDVTLQKGRRRKQEELYTEFLFKLSEMMRGGLDPIKSVRELSKTDLGLLTPHVRFAANAMAFGKSFEDAMREMTQSLKSELISRYTELVIQASYSGGSVSDLILKSSEDMRSIISLEREKEGNLKQYVMIFYFAQGIIVYIVYTLQTSLLPFFSDIGATSFLGTNEIANIDFAVGFFHLIMLNALFGGLIIGKISEGDTRYGLKHVAILMIGCYIASSIFILAPPLEEDFGEINIEIIDGFDQTGLSGISLSDPIVVKVTDTEGNPVKGVNVVFEVLPEGTVDPEIVKTNKAGEASTTVTCGDVGGDYIVKATAEDVSDQISFSVMGDE